ncbi:2',3'-cyclic-nucleotide 2'-phosphodiesterase/5'-or 3'-nucleotidase, 5'-nucleotidase family [Oceanobacillus limi]|uniref:2',3'-cyclic-nucleotide 2'-phosphodiesterase/5'-or 3'-nucleotidase, 5'-nucleotidase family n=1 Tax=Oceanobacillus limi TaxID=930131 RepID=A0A1I0B0A0_9BACI|nr:5'-nucleotidase C-terminal domain-containing protein [Oceanobacillus limi]SET00211.1 2',3'-cyclic-nucleotide 2'-phosphodiesterase/5'-or 3'-nucleotidase, 5'-nucleotidase family [Oceanobacillus limi]
MKNSIVQKGFYLFLIFALVFMNFSSVFTMKVSAESEEEFAEDLFISEYIEGSSYNKAIEIFNGTGQVVDLGAYQLQLYSNGASTPTQTLNLSGELEHGDVLVMAHPSADQAIIDVSDMTNGALINFNGDDAFVLAKNDQVLDVIGIVGERESFGQDKTFVRDASVTAPKNTYEEMEWTDYAQDTFAYLGSHTMDGVDPNDPGEPGEPGETIDIADARELSDGTIVTVEGIVTAANEAISNGSQFTTYIQDDTGGINLFSYEQGELPNLEKGDLVQVVGELDSYNGLKEIIPDSIEVVEKGQELPEAQQITLEDLQDSEVAESYEGELVQVNGYIHNIPDTPAGGGYNVSFIDEEFNGTTLRVMENALDISQVDSDRWYDVTAIVSQYNDYQLIPTEQADIELAAEQPAPPSAKGFYETTVESITDGDTIRVADPVFGETRVRFLNMDTPETYAAHNNDPDREEVNANQKYYGDLATDYMRELLQPGDEIYLKIGDEPTDDYGRILAEVIRKDDDININLEMVAQGYASTYFIAPIDEEVYPDYQNAVKEAKDAELGIWNSENPLLELPFVFRAFDDQKGLLRYVGNSDTLEYVEPQDWADVPVEKRIFFSSAEEAESYGYAPVDGGDNADPNILELQLLSMNDLHGKIDQEYTLDPDGDGNSDWYGRMDYTASAIKERKMGNENTLIVHAGDMIGGSSPVSGLLQDEPTVEIMEEIGFDVGTVGNHEFDEGLDELLRMVNGGEHPDGLGTDDYDGMNFPVLCANCIQEDTGENFLLPFHVEEVDGVEIGFIGVNTQETVNMVMPSSLENVAFTDEVEAVNDAASQLTAQGVEAIIVLAHMPASQSGESATGDAANLARDVDDAVDVIFAAHNHQVVDAVVDNKLIVQAAEYGQAFADVDLKIDRTTGDIFEKEAEVEFVNQADYTPDEKVATILDTYAEEIASIINEVVGYNFQDLTGSYTNDSDHGLGNLIADGMNWAMDSDFAMMNGGGIRDVLLEGPITWGELYNIQPFGNTLMRVEIKGADLYPILNDQLSSYGSDYSISGFHYTFNPELQEVVEITLPDGSPINEEAVYTLTINNYMGTSEGPIKELGQNPIMGPEDIDATVDFVRSLNSSESNPIVYGPEGRIAVMDEVPGEEERPVVEIEPKKNNGTATVHTRDLEALEDGVQVVINIYNAKKPRKLLLNKKQVDILKDKEVTLVVTNGSNSKTFEMIDVKAKVLKVNLED